MSKHKIKVTDDGVSSCLALFDSEECLLIIDWAIRNAECSTGLIHARLEASETPLRRCKEYLMDPQAITFKDNSTLASRVYDAFTKGNVWNLAFSEVPSIRVMEYQTGDGYGSHTDWSNGAAKNRKISMTTQLSNPGFYKGGAVTLFAGPESQEISNRQGDATMWPSWTLHSVNSILSGVRYSLTSWAHGEPYR